MLAVPDDLVFLHVLQSGYHEDLPLELPTCRGQASSPIVPSPLP